MTNEELRTIIAQVVTSAVGAAGASGGQPVPAEVSARHVHLTQQDVETLFGKGHQLTPKRDLSQPGQFLCEERVTVLTGKGEFKNVAILGPVRKETQVELSLTDARSLGINAPVRQSGDVANSASVFLLAGNAMLEAKSAAIVAQNHIHMTPADAARYGVCDGQKVKVRMATSRPVTFDDVVIRVSDKFALAMHIDFDEANACAFTKGDKAYLIGGSGSVVAAAGCPCEQQVAQAEQSSPIAQKTTCSQRLITEQLAKELVKQATGPVVLPENALLTPMAKDIFRAAKVSYELKGEKAEC